MTAYYNEFEPFAAAWLRELIKAGHIAAGDVDERSIAEVKPDDLKKYTQCHFFAGIGGWSLALRLAMWPDDRIVWTGSCPCQPFSTAGNRKGKSDERHLWPIWFNLIKECRPSSVFGEQVSSAIAQGWLDDVYNDLEAQGYAVGSAVLPACSVGAPHKRDRLWFVGNAEHDGHTTTAQQGSNGAPVQHNTQGQNSASEFERASASSDVADTECLGQSGQGQVGESLHTKAGGIGQASGAFNDSTGFEWIDCPDGKARPVKSGLCLLAHEIPNRVGKLRGYGNAIVPSAAAEFIKATM